MPLVSVIIPTMNRADTFLPQAIDSVISQTFKDWELFVVDDEPSKRTEALVATYTRLDARIRYIRAGAFGPGKARHTAALRSNAEYLAFLDDDDMWLPAKLKNQLAVMQEESSLGFVYSKAVVIDKGNTCVAVKPAGPPALMFRDLIRQNAVTLSSVLVRRGCYEEAGGFDTDIKPCEDYSLWLRLSRLYPFRYINEPLVRYRWHGRNLSSGSVAERVRMTLLVFQRLRSFSIPKEEKHLIDTRISQLHHLLARLLIFEGSLSDARRNLTMAWQMPCGLTVPQRLRGVFLWLLSLYASPLLSIVKRRWRNLEPQLFLKGAV